jgi:hypothetical protein
MVYAEAALAGPLIAGYAYPKGGWKNRPAREYATLPESREVKFQGRALQLPE